jgi:hypothetical protein
MFAGSRSKSSSRRTLAGFLRTRTTSAMDGCDPEEFARHVASYLKASDEKRATAQPPVIGPAVSGYDEATPVETQPVEPPPAAKSRAEETVEPDTPPIVVDSDSLDRLVADLHELFETVRPVPVETPPGPPQAFELPVEIEPRRDLDSTADEWGLFDPKQCGLDTLLEKLKATT